MINKIHRVLLYMYVVFVGQVMLGSLCSPGEVVERFLSGPLVDLSSTQYMT